MWMELAGEDDRQGKHVGVWNCEKMGESGLPPSSLAELLCFQNPDYFTAHLINTLTAY